MSFDIINDSIPDLYGCVLFKQQTWLHVWNFWLLFLPSQYLIFYFLI